MNDFFFLEPKTGKFRFAKTIFVLVLTVFYQTNALAYYQQVLDSSHKCNITLIVDDCRKNLVGGHEPMSFSGSVV